MRVNNHALLRYIERVIGIDVEAIRSEIIDLAQPGSPELSKIVVEDGVVVTILGDGMRAKKKKKSEICSQSDDDRAFFSGIINAQRRIVEIGRYWNGERDTLPQ